MKHVKAVIFDLDGTLVLSARLHYRAYQKALGIKRFSISYATFKARYFGRGARYIVGEFLNKNVNEKIVETYAKKKQKLFSNLLRVNTMRTVPGVRSLIKKLTAEKTPLAIASAAQRKSIVDMLHKTKLESFFPVIVSGEEVTHTKPAPDIFLATAKKLRVPPRNCLVFEDTSEGVTAAKKAGMYCIALLTTRSKKELQYAGADEVIQNFTKM